MIYESTKCKQSYKAEVYQSDSVQNGMDTAAGLVASDTQPVGNYTRTASSDIEIQDPTYAYFWIDNDNMPFNYSVVS